jgi:TolB-like protein
MGRVFLSYAREDRQRTETLARVLEKAGHEVWWDRHIDSGDEFAAQIEAELDKADVVLVVWSNASVKSRWVRDEAAVGGDTGRLVPVSIDGTLPPMGFRQFHTMDLSRWNGSKRDPRTAELLHSVERRLKGKGNQPVSKAPLQPKKRIALPTRKSLWAIAGALVLIIAAGAAVLWTNRNQLQGPPAKPTVALLAFTTASPDPQLRDIASLARQSISQTLSQTGVPVRQFDAPPQDRRAAGDFLLSGEVSKSGDKVIATVHVDEAIHGVTIATEKVEGTGDDVRNLPERIGAHMADFFEDNLLLDLRHPVDPALMAELFSGQNGDFVSNYQIMKRVVAKAPDEPSALVGLAYFTGFALGELPRDERQQAVIDARRGAEKVLKLKSEYGGTYATWCFLHSESRLAECEDHIRAGSRIDPDEPWQREFLADVLLAVGRFHEAGEFSNLAFTRAPYSPFMIRGMLQTLEFTGDNETLGELYPQAVRWYPGWKLSFFRNRLYGLLERGDFAAIERLEKDVGADVLPPEYTRTGVIGAAIKSKSQPALRRICVSATPEEFYLAIRCVIAFGIIGDEDGAYALADKLYPRRVGRTPQETEQIWLNEPDGGGPLKFVTSPAAAPLRRDPRYLALAERTGLLQYWHSGRLPDFCRDHPEPICGHLLKRS